MPQSSCFQFENFSSVRLLRCRSVRGSDRARHFVGFYCSTRRSLAGDTWRAKGEERCRRMRDIPDEVICLALVFRDRTSRRSDEQSVHQAARDLPQSGTCGVISCRDTEVPKACSGAIPPILHEPMPSVSKHHARAQFTRSVVSRAVTRESIVCNTSLFRVESSICQPVQYLSVLISDGGPSQRLPRQSATGPWKGDNYT